jgi:hypothetical protein
VLGVVISFIKRILFSVLDAVISFITHTLFCVLDAVISFITRILFFVLDAVISFITHILVCVLDAVISFIKRILVCVLDAERLMKLQQIYINWLQKGNINPPVLVRTVSAPLRVCKSFIFRLFFCAIWCKSAHIIKKGLSKKQQLESAH